MNPFDQASPSEEGATKKRTFGQRLLPVCYFTAVAIAMVGWVWAIGWVVFAAAHAVLLSTLNQ